MFHECLVKPRVTQSSLVAESLTIVHFLEYHDFSRIIYSLSQISEQECQAKVFFHDLQKKEMNERMNERMNEWMNEWKHERTN